MKEEDLIKKLKNTEIPDIKLKSHQRRLRQALLDTDYLNQRRGFTILKLAKSKVIGVKDTMIRGLISRQPVWKTATVSILVLALALGMGLTIPALATKSVYAQASEIVRNSTEVHAALGDGEVTVVKVINIEEDKGTVIAQGETGTVSAKVNLKTNSVIDITTVIVDEQAAIDIAKDDTRVKELLAHGATIGDISTMYVCGEMGNVKTGETEVFSETFVMVEIKSGENLYIAHINLTEGELTRLTETSLDAVPAEPPKEGFFSIPDIEAGFSGEDDQ
jgi:hypothetical protein